MTDQTPVTDDDRRKAHEWARMAADNNHDPHNVPWRVAARLFLDHVPAPPKTLAGELRELNKGDIPLGALLELADRVEAVEKENRAALNHAYDERDEALVERDDARAEAKTWREQDKNYREFRGKFRTVQQERDEARAEVERLKRDLAEAYKTRDEARTKAEEVEGHLSKSWRQRDAKDVELERLSREREQQEKALVEHGRLLAEARAAFDEVENRNLNLEADLRESHAEVERLTASLNRQCTTVTPSVHNTDGLTASNDTLPDPADVPLGSAYQVSAPVWGTARTLTGVKTGTDRWVVYSPSGETGTRHNSEIELRARLVPEVRRVIDRPDDLDALSVGSVVLDRASHAWEKYPDDEWYSTELDDGLSSRRFMDYDIGPVTVIHEEVTA